MLGECFINTPQNYNFLRNSLSRSLEVDPKLIFKQNYTIRIRYKIYLKIAIN